MEEKQVATDSVDDTIVATQGNAVSHSEMNERKPMATAPSFKPNVSVKEDYGVRFVHITHGWGGFRIGETIASGLYGNPFIIAANTSTQDLDMVDLPDSQKFKIGGPGANGCGKDRKKAKQYYKNYAATVAGSKEDLDVVSAFLMMYEEVLFHPTKQTIIIVSYSSDGGSGSGIGPIFASELTNYINYVESFEYGGNIYKIDDKTNIVPRPVVVSVTPKASIKSFDGSGNGQFLQNSIECFSEIQKAIDAGVGHFFIADNNIIDKDVKYNSVREAYDIINARIAAPLIKFLGVEMNSQIKCMDLQDKINTLRISGASSFMSLTNENIFQYVVPRGQSATRIVTMLKYDPEHEGESEKLAKALLNKHDIISLDNTQVFFESGKTNLGELDSMSKELLDMSMIGVFGFKNLNAIIEDLQDSLHRTMVATEQRQTTINQNSKGFAFIEEDNSALKDRFSGKQVSKQDLRNLF